MQATARAARPNSAGPTKGERCLGATPTPSPDRFTALTAIDRLNSEMRLSAPGRISFLEQKPPFGSVFFAEGLGFALGPILGAECRERGRNAPLAWPPIERTRTLRRCWCVAESGAGSGAGSSPF